MCSFLLLLTANEPGCPAFQTRLTQNVWMRRVYMDRLSSSHIILEDRHSSSRRTFQKGRLEAAHKIHDLCGTYVRSSVYVQLSYSGVDDSSAHCCPSNLANYLLTSGGLRHIGSDGIYQNIPKKPHDAGYVLVPTHNALEPCRKPNTPRRAPSPPTSHLSPVRA